MEFDEIIDFGDAFIDDASLMEKIDAVAETDNEEDTTILNTDLVDDEDSEDLDLTEEEKEKVKKAKSKKEEPVEEVEETETIENTEEVEVSPLKIFALELKERHLLDIEEDWDGDEEALFEAHAATQERRALELAKSKYKIEDPRVDSFLNYVANGGDINNYIQTESEYAWIESDIEDEDNATILVKNYLKHVKNLDDEEASDMIESYKEKGRLFSQAGKVQTELRQIRERNQEELIQSQEAFAAEQKRVFKETTNKIRTIIQAGKAGNVALNKNKKSQFENFIFTPVDIKNDKGVVVNQMTEFKKVLNDYFNDPEKFVQLAYKMFEGFNDTAANTEADSRARTKLADALKSKVRKQAVSSPEKIEFVSF